MKLKIMTSAVLALFISNAAIAEDQKPSSSKSIVVKQQFEVIQIDYDARWVLAKDRSGFTKKVHIGSDVINFDQVKVGDLVDVSYAETIEIKAFGADAISAGQGAETVFARAPKGQKPGKAAAVARTLVLTITAIDLENSTVTLKDTEGTSRTFHPRIAGNLKKVKVGDKVAVSIAKALAISVKKGENK